MALQNWIFLTKLYFRHLQASESVSFSLPNRHKNPAYGTKNLSTDADSKVTPIFLFPLVSKKEADSIFFIWTTLFEQKTPGHQKVGVS